MAGIHVGEREGDGGGVPCEAHTYCKLWTVYLASPPPGSTFFPKVTKQFDFN